MTYSEDEIEELRRIFEEKTMPEPNSGCLLWLGTLSAYGYGAVHINGSRYRVHRVSYELFKGEIPEGLQIDHLCRVRLCVNPDHLEAVTSRENTMRGLAGINNKIKTHCPYGHEYDDENTRWKLRKSTGKYYRVCKTCYRQLQQKYYYAKKAAQEMALTATPPQDGED